MSAALRFVARVLEAIAGLLDSGWETILDAIPPMVWWLIGQSRGSWWGVHV